MNSKTKAKMILWQVLKAVTYLAGLPLLVWLIIGSVGGIDFGFLGGRFQTPVVVYICALVALIAIQVVVGIRLKGKSHYLRAGIIALVAFALVLGPLIYVEVGVRGDVNALNEKYADNPHVGADRYNPHAIPRFEDNMWLGYEGAYRRVDNLNNRFRSTYNIRGNGGNENANGRNTDTSRTARYGTDGFFLSVAGQEPFLFGEGVGNMQYSHNGLPAEGWIFGYDDAKFILETFMDVTEKLGGAAAAEQAYQNAFRTRNSIPAYIAYQNSNPVWDMVFGNIRPTTQMVTVGGVEYRATDLHGTLNGQITITRLRAIIVDLQRVLSGNAPHLAETRSALSSLRSLVNVAGGDFAVIVPVLETLPTNNYNAFMLAVGNLLLDFDIDFGALLGVTLPAIEASVQGVENFLLALIGEMMPYQSPVLLPWFYFIQNENLRTYAYARYIGVTHGAAVGSALISINGSGVGDGGNTAMSQNDLLRLFRTREAYEEDMANILAWLSIREHLIIFAAIVPLMTFLAYMFADMEKKNLVKLINRK